MKKYLRNKKLLSAALVVVLVVVTFLVWHYGQNRNGESIGKLPNTSCGTIAYTFADGKLKPGDYSKLQDCFIPAYRKGSKASINYEFRGVDTYTLHTYKTDAGIVTDDLINQGGIGPGTSKVKYSCNPPKINENSIELNCGDYDKVRFSEAE